MLDRTFIIVCIFIYANWFSQGYEFPPIDDAILGLTERFNSRSLVLVLDTLGLANRLRVLSDWYQMAVITKRTLYVSWMASISCNIQLHELIESGPPNLKLLPFALPANDFGRQIIQKIANSANLTFEHLHASNSTFIVEKYLLMSAVDVILTFQSGQRVLRGVPCAYYTQKKADFYQSLVLKQDIQKFVDEVVHKHLQHGAFIGVHIRVHDERFDWAVVPPSSDGTALASNFGVGATVEDFLFVLNGIASSWNRHAQRTLKIFLASNSQEVKQQMLAQLPNLITLGGDFNRSSTESIKNAFIEMMILSKASLLINTYGSSFAVEAAYAGSIPVVGIHNHSLVHHLDTHLPYCGLMQYVRAYSSVGVRGLYTEGTKDKRKIDSLIVTLQASALLDQWGFNDVVYAMHTV